MSKPFSCSGAQGPINTDGTRHGGRILEVEAKKMGLKGNALYVSIRKKPAVRI